MKSTEPGKAVWWSKRNHSDLHQTDTWEEALDQATSALKKDSELSEVVINYKAPDGEYLDAIRIQRIRFPKQKPFEWKNLLWWRK